METKNSLSRKIGFVVSDVFFNAIVVLLGLTIIFSFLKMPEEQGVKFMVLGMIAAVVILIVRSIIKLNKGLYILKIDDDGLTVKSEANDSVNDFYPKDDYGYNISTFTQRNNGIVTMKDITLSVYDRQTQEDVKDYSLNVISKELIAQFNSVADRQSVQYRAQHTNQEENEEIVDGNNSNPNTTKIELQAKDFKTEASSGVLLIVVSLPVFLYMNEWLGIFMFVFAMYLFIKLALNKGKNITAAYIENGNLYLETPKQKYAFSNSDVTRIAISAPGQRNGMRVVQIDTTVNSNKLYFGLLADNKTDGYYQDLIDILFAFNTDKVEYLDR